PRARRSRPGIRIPRAHGPWRVSHVVRRPRVAARGGIRPVARDLVATGTSGMIDYDAFFSRAAATMQESAIRKMGALGLRVPDLISFAPGFPAPDVFAWDEFRAAAQALLDGSDGTVLQYGPTRGYRPLVEAVCGILAE